MKLPASVTVFLAACMTAAGVAAEPVVRVGSKVFTESVILGEMAAQLVEHAGCRAEHRRQLGGTQILWNALVAGEIDIYPEYTGTIREEIMARRSLPTDADLRAALNEQGIAASRPLGFSNTYALGILRPRAERLHIETISDLAAHADLRLAFSNEFMDRRDGWPALARRYRLPHREVRGMDHDLAYRALVSGSVDVTDLYSTDAQIAALGLRVLRDDLRHFQPYDAIFLYRRDLAERMPRAVKELERLAGRISAEQMIAMNARAQLDHVSESQVAADFLSARLGIRQNRLEESRAGQILLRTREHLTLVGISLAAAIAIGVPLGVLAARRPRLGRGILGITAIIYTIPSLALLVFMIPLLGIGAVPAMVALFLYSLLPIVRNTTAGLRGIPAPLAESAEVLALSRWARLRRIELPLAWPSILAGFKTAAVINVGTATLGALVGAGGYGQPILTGVRLGSTPLILEGAIPAAVMALAAQGLFDILERVTVPRSLRGG